MKSILVASTNPVKMNAALEGFQTMFPEEVFHVEGISVPSGVPDQPVSDPQTLQGAINRVAAAAKLGTADYYLGIEGGIEYIRDGVECFAWIVIQDRDGRRGKARTAMFVLPTKIVEHIKAGHELGTAADMVFGDHNSKQKGGSVGILTGNTIDRTAYYHHAIILALIPFKHPELF